MSKKKSKKKKLKKDAWDLLSKIIRKSSADSYGMVTCYTCDARGYWEKDGMQAGHLLDGRNNSILFEERCLKVQCYGCNCGRSGNKEVFIPKFIDEHGRELFDELVRQKNTTRKISESEYEEMIEDYKQRLEGK